jgi:hypothetical protein
MDIFRITVRRQPRQCSMLPGLFFVVDTTMNPQEILDSTIAFIRRCHQCPKFRQGGPGDEAISVNPGEEWLVCQVCNTLFLNPKAPDLSDYYC